MKVKIESVFGNNERVPQKYTCDGEDVNPPLKFSDIPPDSESLVIITDDPDSPSKTWVHWVIWNISPDRKEIQEGKIPEEAEEGLNDFGECGYRGPCPRKGSHRYQFKIYALDIFLNLPTESTKEDVERAISGHVIAKAALTGIYSR